MKVLLKHFLRLPCFTGGRFHTSVSHITSSIFSCFFFLFFSFLFFLSRFKYLTLASGIFNTENTKLISHYPFINDTSCYMEPTCAAVYISRNKCTYAGGKCLLKSLAIEVQIVTSSRFPATVGCFCAASIS